MGTLATILSVGAVSLPSSGNSAPKQGTEQVNASTGVAKRAPAAVNVAPGGLIQLLKEHGGGDEFVSTHRNGRKEWGMSAACHNKRMHNVRKGLVPHYKPQKQA